MPLLAVAAALLPIMWKETNYVWWETSTADSTQRRRSRPPRPIPPRRRRKARNCNQNNNNLLHKISTKTDHTTPKNHFQPTKIKMSSEIGLKKLCAFFLFWKP